jgi:uncharacterized membrane protein YhiD involved in acid resistance
MDEFLKLTNVDLANYSVPTLVDFILGYLIALIASFIIAYSYRKTHNGYSFSSSFMISLILISIIISLIMIIIGSNIARAFALVGAMSIVRFRNPVKETRDLVFIFASISVGMAAGTGFYIPAILFSILFFITNLIFDNVKIFEANSFVHIIAINGTNKEKTAFEDKVKNNVRKFTLLSMSSSGDNNSGEFVYEVELDTADSFERLKKSLTEDQNIPSLRIIFGDSAVSS